MSTGSGCCVTGAADAVQGRGLAVLSRACRVAATRGVVLGAMSLGLAGCGANGELAPVNWWHDLEGGTIAQSRPPPPNIDQPFPSLGTVPTRPVAIDSKTRATITARLLADRANAHYVDQLMPLPAPVTAKPATASPPGAPPFGQPAAATDPDSQMNASLPAATATPPSATKSAAPADLLGPPTAGAPPATDAALMPTVPAGPPAAARLPGVLTTTVATPPPPTPPPVVVRPVFVAGAPLPIPFAQGSATVPGAALPALRQLAARRGTAAVAVTGYGDAPNTDIDLQTASMSLAWDRAQAIARVLQSDGVPSSSLRIASDASGRGGVAQLTE
jgi:outer membrane protein OmpA-like peptidoglycan-associated protein